MKKPLAVVSTMKRQQSPWKIKKQKQVIVFTSVIYFPACCPGVKAGWFDPPLHLRYTSSPAFAARVVFA